MTARLFDSRTIKHSTALPFVLSIALHALIGMGLFFWQSPKPKTVPISIETTFVSASELAGIENAIRQNAAALAKGQEGSNTISTNAHTDTEKQLSAHMQAYNEEMARREAAFNAEIQALSDALDEQISNDIQAIEAQVLTEEQQQAEKLAEVRQAYELFDERIQQNQAALEEAKKARDEQIALAEQEKQASSSVSSLQTSATPSIKISSGTQNPPTTSAQAGNDSTNAIITALIRLIEPKWHVPANAKGERLTATIRTDANGNVLSVQVKGGGSQALRASLESAIFNASPLTPLKGTEHQTLTIHFKADPP